LKIEGVMMDLNRVINMLTRMVLRSVIKTGVNFASRKGKPDAALTPAERKQAAAAKALADKAQKAARLGRRFLR
jgi:hypothetical protein